MAVCIIFFINIILSIDSTESKCPPSRAALLIIRNLKLDVEIIEVNTMAGEHLNNEEFVRINPQHTVPTLDDHGFILWESRAIATYLVEKYAPGSTLLPHIPKEQAIINQRLYFDMGTLMDRFRKVVYPVFGGGQTVVPQEAKDEIYEAFGYMEEMINDVGWFASDTVTVADLCLLASISSVLAVGFTLRKYPRLTRWYENCRTLPGFDENEACVNMIGEMIKGKLTEPIEN